ncbi:hypothetical protein Q8791_03495 [Nocardiopsis sp. CT-R113]|uniref:Uncharacterized protein n=1 Tax=Nocardiopsis codii TaxID=3065942 RepID=A0ABU7K346_9ACTN|nr:hypothetical protein [Nocardiopsis sp. CT-R113]MEE2036284.1 hypothetical protein [Nocardiopsis sp. CT-R113]
MVLTGRGWLVSTGRAACVSRSACARLLLLSGIVAVAWLAGGIGVAHSETASGADGLVDRVMDLGDTAEETGQTAAQEIRSTRLSDTAAHAGSATETLTGHVVPQAAALPANALHETGVTSALEDTRTGAAAGRVVGDTASTVDGTARGAGNLVGGIARTGQDVVRSTDDSLRDGGLVGTVAEGLTESTRAVHGGISEAANVTAPLGLPVLGATDELTTDPAGPAVKRTSTESGRGTQVPRPGTSADTGVHAAPTAWSSAALEAAERVHDDDPGERIRLIGGGGSHHSAGADATGATAPSFPAPGAAGFLMARAGHLAPRAQRVALPGDPTLVVRDAADDPSFAPD